LKLHVNPEFSLSGQVAAVTGGSRSMGRAIAQALAEAGAHVAVSGRSIEDLRRVADEVRAFGVEGLAVRGDVKDPESGRDFVASCVETLGGLDILVANAGIFVDGMAAEDVGLEDWEKVIATNLRGAMLACQAAGRVMLANGRGSIVTISSVEGKIASPGGLAYIASKHGVIGLTKSLAVEWGARGVRVNAVCPGFIARDNEPLLDDPDVNRLISTRAPIPRWGTSREVGLAVVFLASSAASFITGATLEVDGGWLAA
jgi:NAD(P)-dependent dehydrogenase (short-subunit alcohol dehydrogenase family)